MAKGAPGDIPVNGLSDGPQIAPVPLPELSAMDPREENMRRFPQIQAMQPEGWRIGPGRLSENVEDRRGESSLGSLAAFLQHPSPDDFANMLQRRQPRRDGPLHGPVETWGGFF